MAISTLAGYRSSQRQPVLLTKTPARVTDNGVSSSNISDWLTLWDATGVPGAGSLNPGNTSNGAVPDNTTAGAASITGFAGGAIGYLTRAILSMCGNLSGEGCGGTILIYDRLYHAGQYSFNSNVTLSSQPSYSARLPNTDYHGLQVWFETATTFTGTPSIAITYTDQDGNTGHAAPSFSPPPGAPSIGTMWPMPLAAGDSGIRKLESVVATVASAGKFNIVIGRPLCRMHVPIDVTGSKYIPGEDIVHWLDRTGMPQVFSSSCIAMAFQAVTSAGGTTPIEVELEIASA